MKKIIPITIVILILGFVLSHESEWKTGKESKTQDTLDYDRVTTIQEIVEWAEQTQWSEEEAERLDSMNALGHSYLVRGSERNLDTIVNHLQITYTTDK